MIIKKIEKRLVKIDVVGATILSVEEAENLPVGLREYKTGWWLRSPGHDSVHAATVIHRGPIYDYGEIVNYTGDAVRPALKISNLESSNFQVGDRFKFGGKPFQVISNCLAFCLGDIGQHCFRENRRAPEANDYEKSDIKKYVDDWFEKTIQHIKPGYVLCCYL